MRRKRLSQGNLFHFKRSFFFLCINKIFAFKYFMKKIRTLQFGKKRFRFFDIRPALVLIMVQVPLKAYLRLNDITLSFRLIIFLNYFCS